MKEYMKAAPNYSGTGGRQTRWDQEEEKEDEPYNPEDPVVSDDEEQRPPPLPRSLVQRGAAAAQAAGSIQINLASKQMMSKRSGITNQVGEGTGTYKNSIQCTCVSFDQCCGSWIRGLFDLFDPGWVKNLDPDPA
jgi:hypothetical protein